MKLANTFLVLWLAALAGCGASDGGREGSVGTLILERSLLRPGNEEPNGYRLYVYLLMEAAADHDKRLSALHAYACGIPGAGAVPYSGDRGLFLIPVTTVLPKDLNERKS